MAAARWMAAGSRARWPLAGWRPLARASGHGRRPRGAPPRQWWHRGTGRSPRRVTTPDSSPHRSGPRRRSARAPHRHDHRPRRRAKPPLADRRLAPALRAPGARARRLPARPVRDVGAGPGVAVGAGRGDQRARVAVGTARGHLAPTHPRSHGPLGRPEKPSLTDLLACGDPSFIAPRIRTSGGCWLYQPNSPRAGGSGPVGSGSFAPADVLEEGAPLVQQARRRYTYKP